MAESTPLIDEVSLEEQNKMADHASNKEVRDHGDVQLLGHWTRWGC